MTTLRSFWKGWVEAAALWPAVLLLFLVDGSFALILAMPWAARLGEIFGHSAMAPELTGPLTVTLLLEAVAGSEGALSLWPVYLLAPFLFLLVGIFLRGGVLGALARGSRSFCWPDFFADCARFFWRFLLLLFFFVPWLLAVALIFSLGSLLLGLIPGSSQATLAVSQARLALLGFLGFLLLISMDYARVSLVLDPGRSLWRHVGRALRFLVLRFPQAVLLGLGFALVGVLIAVVYPALLQGSPLLEAFIPALVVQQSTILLATWQRVATLGSEMALYSRLSPRINWPRWVWRSASSSPR